MNAKAQHCGSSIRLRVAYRRISGE
jgi:hypothetical protein